MKDVALLKQALPYIRTYKGKVFVVKFGGQVAQDRKNLEYLAEDLSLLHQVGIRLVIIHGGGPQATELSKKLGLEPNIINGRRVTTDDVLEVAKMVYAGKINVEVLSALRRHGTHAVGVSGVDGDLVRAKRRKATLVKDEKTGDETMVDFGHVGDIESVNVHVLRVLLDGGFVPVVASLGADEAGNIYNINADTVAAALAIELGAEKFINMTSVPGILRDKNDPGTKIPYLSLEELQTLVQSGVVQGGMLPKVKSCEVAVRGGVRHAHILDGQLESSLLLEIFTRSGTGTMIMKSQDLDAYKNSLKDVDNESAG